jgi:hypothetical protein
VDVRKGIARGNDKWKARSCEREEEHVMVWRSGKSRRLRAGAMSMIRGATRSKECVK